MSGQLSEVGVVGLCSVGRSFALRLAATGLRVSLWDASPGSAEEFVARHNGTRGGLVGYADCEDFVESLNSPRRIMVFETESGPVSASLRGLLCETDRLLEYPFHEDGGPFDEFAQLELTLVFQMS